MSDDRRATYLLADQAEMPYCPGCGHTSLVRAIDNALVELQPEPSKVVIVTDIGCIGLADRHFDTNAFHGLHGRAITYACGLKLARPELTVIALMGDGGCGIGGAHLLNVARRNIGITLIVANNFNYGMTGGQHSVATPLFGVTATTPWGNVERPLDISATVAAAGGSWVHRTTTFDPELPRVIAEAISEPGFSMVEAWELCTAYYTPKNDFKKKELDALAQRTGLAMGRIVCQPRSEYSASYRAARTRATASPSTRSVIEITHDSAVEGRVGILVAGGAGQKVRSASSLFARAGIASGLYATQKDDYPITVMTGHSVSELILSSEPIEFTGLVDPEHVLVLSEPGLGRVRTRIERLPASSIVYIDEGLEAPPTAATVRRYPFEAAAKKIKRTALSMVGLGAVLEHAGFYPRAALEAAIARSSSDEVARVNLAAVAAGAALESLPL